MDVPRLFKLMRNQGVLPFVLGIILLGCGGGGTAQNGAFPKVAQAPEFKQLMEQHPEATLLDVRTLEETAKGTLNGALTMDFNRPDFRTKSLELPKDKPILVYCLSGGRSRSAADYLRRNGYAMVTELAGGLLQWKAAGFDLTEKVPQNHQGMSLADFQKELASSVYVLVDFQAKWCKPCQIMKPDIRRLLDLHPEIKGIDLDVDVSPEVSNAYRIEGLPTLHWYLDGQLVKSVLGLQSFDQLEAIWLEIKGN